MILESPHHSFPFCILTHSAIFLFVQSEVVTVNGKDSPQAMRRILQENPDGRVMLLARRYHQHAVGVQEAVQTEETSNHWAVLMAQGVIVTPHEVEEVSTGTCRGQGPGILFEKAVIHVFPLDALFVSGCLLLL